MARKLFKSPRKSKLEDLRDDFYAQLISRQDIINSRRKKVPALTLL